MHIFHVLTHFSILKFDYIDGSQVIYQLKKNELKILQWVLFHFDKCGNRNVEVSALQLFWKIKLLISAKVFTTALLVFWSNISLTIEWWDWFDVMKFIYFLENISFQSLNHHWSLLKVVKYEYFPTDQPAEY
jgi:hypothetical protein